MSSDLAASSSLGLLHDVIDKIVVVTVPSATERHAQVRAFMETVHLRFDFHYGSDCRNTTAAELALAGEYDPVGRERLQRPPMTPGEIGCAMSHRDAARAIAAGPDERVLVLEDDVMLIPANLHRFAESIRTMPRDWSLAYFGYAAMNLSTPFMMRVKLISYYPLMHMLGRAQHHPDTIRRIFRRPLNGHWMHAGWFNNTHAYAIDRRAAQYIADGQESVSFEADLILNHLVRFSGLNAICLRHPIFDQRLDLPSLIGDRPSWKASR